MNVVMLAFILAALAIVGYREMTRQDEREHKQ